MEKCFSHFIYGKIIRDGTDYSGFDVIAKSKELSGARIQSSLPSVAIGQITGWDNFMPVFSLTPTLDDGYRVFSYTFKSTAVDIKRGYFPVQHSIIIEGNEPQSYVELAQQFALLSGEFDYAFTEFLEMEPVCMELGGGLQEFPWDVFERDRFAILRVLDSVFYSKSIVVVLTEDNPFHRLMIANAVWLLLPPILRKQFSFHTSFFGSPEKIRSLVKFTNPTVFDTSKHTVIDLRRGDRSLSGLQNIRSDYVRYLFHLLIQENISPSLLSSYCESLLVERGQFSLETAKSISFALKDQVEIPNFIARIKQRSPDLTLEDVLVFFRKPRIFEDTRLVEIIWTRLIESKEREVVNQFIIENLDFVQGVLLANGGTLLVNWLHHLMIKKEIPLINQYLHDTSFLSKCYDLIPVILAFLIQQDTEFDEKKLAFLLEQALTSNDPKEYIKKILYGKPGSAEQIYPLTFDYLRLLGNLQSKLHKKAGSLPNLLSHEIEIDNLVRLSLLGLHTNQLELLNSDLFLLIPKASLNSRFFAEVGKYSERLLNSDLSLRDFGALNALVAAYSSELMRKLFSLRFFTDNPDSFAPYVDGFVSVADNIHTQVKREVYSQLVSALGDLDPVARTQVLLTFTRLTRDIDSGKYLLNQAMQHFSYHAQDITWQSIGEELFGLYSKNSEYVSDVTLQNAVIAYFRAIGRLDQEQTHSMISALISYTIPVKTIVDAIMRAISTASYSVQQRIQILFSLVEVFYGNQGTRGVLGKQVLLQLLSSIHIAYLSDDQLERIVRIASNDPSIGSAVKEEIWKRTLQQSFSRFINLVIVESENKGELELAKIAESIARIWRPVDIQQTRTMLSSLAPERRLLREKLWGMLISGKIESKFEVRFDLIKEQLILLEKQIRIAENSILWLNQGEPEAGSQLDAQSISSIKELFSKKSRIYRALENLEKKTSPSRSRFGRK